MPFTFGYSSLPRAILFRPEDTQAVIKQNIPCNHHAVCYAAMLDYHAADWKSLPPIDQGCVACIRSQRGATRRRSADSTRRPVAKRRAPKRGRR